MAMQRLREARQKKQAASSQSQRAASGAVAPARLPSAMTDMNLDWDDSLELGEDLIPSPGFGDDIGDEDSGSGFGMPSRGPGMVLPSLGATPNEPATSDGQPASKRLALDAVAALSGARAPASTLGCSSSSAVLSRRALAHDDLQDMLDDLEDDPFADDGTGAADLPPPAAQSPLRKHAPGATASAAAAASDAPAGNAAEPKSPPPGGSPETAAQPSSSGRRRKRKAFVD